MQKRLGTMMAAATLLAFAGPVGAGDRPAMTRDTTTVPSTTVDKADASLLESSRQDLAWQGQNAKGSEKAQLRSEEARVQELIDSLQRGDKVDPEDVDRVLNRVN